MRPSVELTHAKAVLTAVIRSRVPPRQWSRFIPAACGEVWDFIRSAALPAPGRHVALYLDQQGTLEVGAEVSMEFAGNERVCCSQLPAGRVATMRHQGPYSSLGETHEAIRQWCTIQELPLSGVSWEIYDHWDESWNSDPAKIRTEVFYLLND